MARTAQVKRDARIGEAEARRDAGIRSAQAEEAKTKETLKNEALVAKAQRDLALKRAACDKEVRALQAKANLAYQLQVRVYCISPCFLIPFTCVLTGLMFFWYD